MKNWIPFEDGEYLVEQALVVAPDFSAVKVERVIVRVSTGRGGIRFMSGRGFVHNMLLVELLELHDDLDMVLDFGAEFKYRLKTPELTSGKVFTPNVKAALQFAPRMPWDQIAVDDFRDLESRLKLLE